MSDRSKKAGQKFSSGCNCAQAVLSSFSEVLGKSEEELISVSAALGGGMGKMQLTCGAVTGSFLMLGYYASAHAGDNSEAKELSGEMVRQFSKKFSERHGSLNCREITGIDMNTEEGEKLFEEKDIHAKVCTQVVEDAVMILEEMLVANGLTLDS